MLECKSMDIYFACAKNDAHVLLFLLDQNRVVSVMNFVFFVEMSFEPAS